MIMGRTWPAPGIKRALRSARGFTLIELLVVCLTAGLLGMAILGVYESLMRSWADTSHRIVNQDDARYAINEISRYIRMAESSASNLSSQSDAIFLATSSELVFYADLNGDALSEKCRYYLDGTTLRLATLAPDTSTAPPTYPTAYSSDGVVIMQGIQEPNLFTYYKMNPAYASNPIPANDTLVPVENPTSAAELRSIIAVDISLRVNETPGMPKANVALDTRVQIRQRYNGGLSGA
jgi:type II secretory pathway pseudopilin PulG